MKTEAYLSEKSLKATEVVNAKKTTLTKKDALSLATEVSEIYAAKGKNVVHINIKKDEPNEETLVSVLVGPTGNLRAPTLRVGKKLIVGFNSEMYDKVFG